MREKQYFVYILTNKTRSTLYVGVTNNLYRRVFAHKNGYGSEFTRKYHVHHLVYYEVCPSAQGAIQREKQLKAGSRKKKLECVKRLNPGWKDLYDSL